MDNELISNIGTQLSTRRYDPTYIPPPENKVFLVRNKLVGTLSNFILLTGLPKASKSTVLSMIMASAFTDDTQLEMKLNVPDNRRICYFDTESSANDFYRQVTRIKKFARLQELPENLDCYCVREDNHATILHYIDYYLKFNDCGVLIIDGLLDLCSNMNDEMESKRLINYFKRVTKEYNLMIITVLHLGKKDLTSIGHIGSAADRYCQANIEIKKNKETQVFSIESKFMRSDIDFDPIAYKIENGFVFEVPHEQAPYKPAGKK